MLASAALLFTQPFTPAFYGVYAACGISDALDGYIARKTQTQSKLGAMLDSLADFLFTGAMLAVILPVLHVPLWVWIWLGGILMIKLATLIIGGIKYRSIAFLHTYLNKLTGLLLFFFPVVYHLFAITPAALLLCVVATLAAGEELVINLKFQVLQPDVKGLFFK